MEEMAGKNVFDGGGGKQIVGVGWQTIPLGVGWQNNFGGRAAKIFWGVAKYFCGWDDKKVFGCSDNTISSPHWGIQKRGSQGFGGASENRFPQDPLVKGLMDYVRYSTGIR